MLRENIIWCEGEKEKILGQVICDFLFLYFAPFGFEMIQSFVTFDLLLKYTLVNIPIGNFKITGYIVQ